VPWFQAIMLSDTVKQSTWEKDCLPGFGLTFEEQSIFVWIVNLNAGKV
jgi:hypothetical protein